MISKLTVLRDFSEDFSIADKSILQITTVLPDIGATLWIVDIFTAFSRAFLY